MSESRPFDYHATPGSPGRPAFGTAPVDPRAKPVLSVVTPFFNTGPVFLETVASVFAQTLQQWEWIIVNDGSSDPAALALLDRFRSGDPRIRVVDHPSNRGLSAARNTGFSAARTEFVFQLDSDDLIEPTALEKLWWHLLSHPEHAFANGFTVGFGSKEYLWTRGFFMAGEFLTENQVTASCLIRKSVHQAVGGYDEANRGGMEDWDFWLKAASRGYWGQTLPEYFDWYRRRETGREHWTNLQQEEKQRAFKDDLRRRYSSLWSSGFPRIEVLRSELANTVADPVPAANRLQKSKRRLLVLVPHFELGGADKFNLDLIRQLTSRQDFEVTVVATRKSKNPWQHLFEALTPDVFALPNFLHVSDYPRFLRYLVDSRQVDAVLVTNSHLGYQLLPYLRAHFPALPLLDYIHMEQEDWMSGGYPRCSINYQAQLDRTMVSSQHLKDWLIRRGRPAEVIEVCSTNIDCDHWNPARLDRSAVAAQWGLTGTVPVILYAGRICDQKQPMIFAESVKRLRSAGLPFTALVAGDGPDLPALREFIEREQIGEVRFLGAVDNGRIRELLALADIFFLPSKMEGISLALFEAMSMGVAVVAADVGGQRELVTGECGFLVPPGRGEVEAYAAILERLLRDPSLRARLGAASRRRIEESFPIEAMGRRIAGLIGSVRTKPGVVAPPGLLVMANLFATEIVEQVRWSEHANDLAARARAMTEVTAHTIRWRSLYEAGRCLAGTDLRPRAIDLFRQAAASLDHCDNQKLKMLAFLAIGRELVALDPVAARGILLNARALLPADRWMKEAEEIEALLNGLKAAPSGAEGITEAGGLLIRATELINAKKFLEAARVAVRCLELLPDSVEALELLSVSMLESGELEAARDVLRHLLRVDPQHAVAGAHLPAVEQALAARSAADCPSVSIVVPCYKLAEFLPEAVESVVAQTWKDWELIVVNDGSPDRTSEVAREWIARYPEARIQLIEQANGGLSAARNAGIRASRGRYVLPLDADDRLHPDMLARAVARLEQDPQVAVVHPHIQHFGLRDDVWLTGPATLEAMTRDNTMPYCSMFRRGVFDAVGGYREDMRDGYEDWDLWLSVLERGFRIEALAEPLFHYRKRAGSMLAGSNEKRQALLAQLVRNHPRLYSDATQKWAADLPPVPARGEPVHSLRVTYLISNIQGVTGGNQTLLRQANALVERGHCVTIVTYSPAPGWFDLRASIVQVPAGRPMAEFVPASDAVISTYFVNTAELARINSPVKVYYAQGDQFIFDDGELAGDTPQTRMLEELSRASYLLPGVRFVANSRNLARAVELKCGRQADAILPVCTDQTIFHPLDRADGPPWRVLIVGPDVAGRAPEPLDFKGLRETREALELLARRGVPIRAVRMSGTPPEIFRDFPCEFVQAPDDATKTRLYGSSHILIYASHYDSCPRPPQEAMAAGVAVVCTDTAGAREYCRDGENSLLVPIKSPAAIADAVQRLVEDPVLRAHVIEGGRKTAAEFPREREWNELEALLKTFVADSVGSSECKSGLGAAPVRDLPAVARLGDLGPARELLRLGDHVGAWSAAVAALARRPFHPEGWLLMAEIARAAGDAMAARRCAERARRLAPGWKRVRDFLRHQVKNRGAVRWPVWPEPPSAPRLSVCLIVRNEEKFLAQCLRSVREIAHQIVVVDTGSTDRTPAIAAEFGAEVHSFTWCDDFSAARNAALERATGDWVLVLDADEEIFAEDRETLRRELAAGAVMAWRLPILDAGREQEGANHVPRLFRNAPGIHFTGRIHEQAFASLEPMRQLWGLENKPGATRLRHHGYSAAVTTDRDKIARNLQLLGQALAENPGDPNLLMNHGLELVRSGRRDEGIGQYHEALRVVSAPGAGEVSPEFRETLLTQLTTHLLAAGRYDEVMPLLRSGLATRGGLTASLHFALGLALMETKNFAPASVEFHRTIERRGQPAMTPVNPEIHRAGPRHCLGRCWQALDRMDEAEQAFRAALEDEPASRPVRRDLARLLGRDSGKLRESLGLVHGLVSEGADEPADWVLGGEIALNWADALEFAGDWTGEALRHFPEHPGIARQRAEWLLLSGQCDAALQLFQRHPVTGDLRVQAATILCALVLGNSAPVALPGLEGSVAREFIQWYRRLIEVGATSVVEAINARVAALQGILPTAASALTAALSEAAA